MGRMRPAGFFALRSPLLPLSDFTSWSDRAAGLPTEKAGAALRAGLREVLERPVVREAIFIASPDLDDSLDAWQTDPDSEKGRRTERALVRYFARMCSRPTPFGLFAGCSLGTLGGATTASRACFAPATSYRRTTRLDMEYVASLVSALERVPELRAHLRFRPNNSIYRAAGRVRYVEALLVDRVRQHRLVAVEDSEYLRDTLERAEPGTTIRELAAPLVDDEITLEEAEAFVEELVDGQLLVSDLEPAITGGDPLACLVERLKAMGGAAAAPADRLAWVGARLSGLDAAADGSRDPYRAIADGLRDLPAPVALPRLFQADMTKPVEEASLGGDLVAELGRAARLLHLLIPAPRSTPLDRFRERFQERYEGLEVPLEETLDEELGIGFDASQAPGAEASPLLRDLAFPTPAGDIQVGWTPTASLLTRKVVAALRSGADDVEISDAEAEKVGATDRPPLPAAFAVSASIAATSAEALEAGDFRVLVQAAVGPSGARMLGRFCHADPALDSAVRAHLAAEEAADPGPLYAEIVHLPEGRVGNITMRPAVRAYEIPYLGRSGVPEDHQLPVSDLLVSVLGGEVVLRSRRLGRRVVPRMTSAHNYVARSVGMYRFLGALQAQGVHGQLAWDWGTLAAAPYLPRVVSGRVVLSRRRWRLGPDELQGLRRDTEEARHEALRELAEASRLPRWFLLSDADNELLTDVENPLSAETFVQLVARRDEAILFELFPAADELWAEGPEGRFVSEVVVPFEAEPAPVETAQVEGSVPSDHRRASRHPPGSDWLYAKLYCGTSTADTVLRELVAPFVREERERGAFDHWFFIRYSDPGWHLRLRFHGEPAALGGMLVRLNAAVAPLLEDGRVSRVVLDTYEPEVARYGGTAALPFAETLFEADSEAVLAIVELLSGDAGMDARWRLALRGADQLLDDLGLALPEKRALARGLRDSFRREFKADARFNGQVGDRYRREARGLRELLLRSADEASPLAAGFALLDRRSVAMAPAINAIRELAREDRLAVSLADLAASLVHMHANRLLRSAHRAQELVLYDFLDRLYMSFAERG